MVETVAGSSGKFGDVDGTGSEARLWYPQSIAADAFVRRATAGGPESDEETEGDEDAIPVDGEIADLKRDFLHQTRKINWKEELGNHEERNRGHILTLNKSCGE